MTKEAIKSFLKNNAITIKGLTIKYHGLELNGYFEFKKPIDKKDKYSFICIPNNKKIIIEGVDIETMMVNK